MRLHKLTLTNFRGFSSLELNLDPKLTVLVGVNGAGKTSILDALAAMLTSLASGVWVGEAKRSPPLTVSDVRAGSDSTVLCVAAEFEGVAMSWRGVLTRPGRPTSETEDLSSLTPIIDAAQESIVAKAPRLPLAVYFPTNRSALDIPSRIRTPHFFDELAAYDGALEGGASNFRGFFEWFRQEEDLFNEQQMAVRSFFPSDAAPSHLPHVRAAIEELFQGATELRIERGPQRMTLLYKGQRLDVSQLSDGEKCLLAMAGDLARRMVLAAPDDPKPLEREAVVLIDEIELHLHPGLQRTILPRLRKVFPNVQLIVTTHSPQVLSAVRSENVRLIEDFAILPLTRATWHRDTNRILESVFGDSGRPPEVAEKLRLLRDAVDEDRIAEARTLIHEIRSMIEGDDPEVFFLEQLLPPEGGTPDDAREVAE